MIPSPHRQIDMLRGRAGFDAWTETIRATCGLYQFEKNERQDFSGCSAIGQIGALETMHVTANLDRVRRRPTDIRRDNNEHFFLIMISAGGMLLEQETAETTLKPGSMAIVDSTRPLTFTYSAEPTGMMSIHIPRQQLIAQLGFVPESALSPQGWDISTNLLSTLISQGVVATAKPDKRAESIFLDLALMDLIGACFAPRQGMALAESTQSNILVARIADLVRRRFRDPGFTASEAAAEIGISLRYLQKLLAARGTSCTRLINDHRLDLAAQLLRRRRATKTKIAIGEIAFSCGFQEISYFSRAFSNRFGCAPSNYES